MDFNLETKKEYEVKRDCGPECIRANVYPVIVEEKRDDLKKKGDEKADKGNDIGDKKKENKDKNMAEDSNNYGGCFYTVGFKVNRPITVTGVSFYGPAKVDHAAYLLNVKMERFVSIKRENICFRLNKFLFGPTFTIQRVMKNYCTRIYGARKGEKFKVNFKNPVKIESNTWTDIKFELQGPDTGRMKTAHSAWTVVLEDGSEVKFDLLRGSMQMPSFYFRLD